MSRLTGMPETHRLRSPGWRTSILWRTVQAVLGIAVLVGLISILITSVVTNSRAHRQVQERLGEMLDTAESSVSVACFAGDELLAREVARGLLRNPDVLAVTIRSDQKLLASESRSQDNNSSTPAPLVRKIYSPFQPPQLVGRIEVVPDHRHILEEVNGQTVFVGLQLAGQLIAVAAAVVAAVLLFFIRPIKAMSDGLHAMDATRGDKLPLPKGLEETEIGRLAGDVNDLSGRLMKVLHEERELRLQREMDEKKYHAIFDNAETGLFVVDREGTLSQANRAFLELFGLPADAPPGRLADLPALDRRHIPALLSTCLADHRSEQCELELPDGQGRTRWINLVLSPIGGAMAQGVASDVTAHKLAEASARRQALTDKLTGLCNRQGLELAMSELIAEGLGPNCPGFALLLVDLDGFRKINDGLGLPAGDQILKVAMARLVNCLKKHDVVARVGGDEFALLLPGVVGKDRISQIAQRIIASLGLAFELPAGPVHLGASIGVALYPADGSDLPALMRNAELALGRAKAAGGGRHQFFAVSMVEAAKSRRRLESDLRQALPANNLELYYQPIIDLAGNRLAGVEALIRWHHPEQGLIPPDAFIPLAEESGFIIEIGRWTLESACRQIRAWQDAGQDLYISVNVSAKQIPEGLPPAMIAAALRRHGATPSRLVLEITEGVLLGDVMAAQDWLKGVRDLGIRTYLDDFGTGYSSLSSLKRGPFDSVKIDKSFVREIGEDTADRALVEAVIAMARGLGLKVVAEGVETPVQLDLLRRLGCHNVQGYHFSRPVPIADFPATQARIEGMLAVPLETA